MSNPALLLLPNLLGEHRHPDIFLPTSVFKAVESIDGLIAESETEGRRFLGYFKTKKPAHHMPIALFNKDTPNNDVDFLLEPIAKGERWGYVSDAGLPCVADPGSLLVWRARQRGIQTQAFVGPSSILMALMLSGLPGQKFTFHGYLDRDAAKRQKQVTQMIATSKNEGTTQMMMEAPHRNQHFLETLLQTLPESACLCVAWDLTLPSQGVVSQPISMWKKTTPPNIEKKPAIFLFALES